MRLAWRHAGVLLVLLAEGCLPLWEPVTSDSVPTSGVPPQQAVAEPLGACTYGELASCSQRCAAGSGQSCNNLGAMEELGKGTARDSEAALRHYDRGCDLIGEAACYNATRLRQALATTAPGDDVYDAPRSSPAEAPKVTADPEPCASHDECRAQCRAGTAESCRALPGVHIAGNVRIHGNVTVFGDVYVYRP
jgi:hypothetical protein